jgi:hypothetical protein
MATTASAQFVTWDNSTGTGIWSTAGGTNANLNWYGDTNPADTATAVFNGNYVSSDQFVNSQNANKTIGSINFAGPYSYTVTSTDASTRRITFQASNNLSTITVLSGATSTASHTLDLDIVLKNTLNIENQVSGTTLDLLGRVDSNAKLIWVGGTGDVHFGDTIAGGGVFTKAGSGLTTFDSSVTVSTFNITGGSILLDSASITGSTMRVTANSIIDFGTSGASTLNFGNLIVDAGVTLTLVNWTDAVDFFYETNSPTMGTNSQIVFSGIGQGGWVSLSQQIRPVPEPATYGAIFTALILGAYMIYRTQQSRQAKLAVAKTNKRVPVSIER